ncbi:hypothetical protein Gotur_019421 [Gossypium turneri]
MKRSFASEMENNLALANCLMLLSQGRNQYDHTIFNNTSNNNPTRVFECKTCNRQFASFQALGGHRASHKKPKLLDGGSTENQPPAKPKTHECSICGLEFSIGQALGGHMRRHRGGLSGNHHQYGPLSSSSSSQEMVTTPIVKKSNSRRVLCLDLNLTPLENDWELFKLGKAALPIDWEVLSDVQIEFNKRHTGTRMVAEMALARLKKTWRTMHGVVWMPDRNRLQRIVLLCCSLHNIKNFWH